MAQVIAYQQNNGKLAVVYPTGELPFEEVARKDVPAGVPYVIVDESDLPQDNVFFEAWEADFSTPHGTGIGAQAWFIEKYQAEIAAINAEIAPAEPSIILPIAYEAMAFHEEATDEEKVNAYALYLDSVKAENDKLAADHVNAVAQWEASKAQRIEALNNQIAVQEEERAA